jgi:tRNA/rRNA methyltransferase
MTPRDFGPPTVAPREHFEMLSKKELLAQLERGLEADLTINCAPGGIVEQGAVQEGAAQQGVAFLFGSERFGMRNEDVYRCHAALSIPSNPQFGSLNIAAAIQVVAYEWRLALGGFGSHPECEPVGLASLHKRKQDPVEGQQQALTGSARTHLLADAAQVAGMLAHLEQALVELAFLDPAAPKKLMPRLNALFNRAQVTQEEIHILRGIAKAILQKGAHVPAPTPVPAPTGGMPPQDGQAGPNG